MLFIFSVLYEYVKHESVPIHVIYRVNGGIRYACYVDYVPGIREYLFNT